MKKRFLLAAAVTAPMLAGLYLHLFATIIQLEGPEPEWEGNDRTFVSVDSVWFHYGDQKEQRLRFIPLLGWLGFPKKDGSLFVRCIYHGWATGLTDSPLQAYVTPGIGQVLHLRRDSCVRVSGRQKG